MRPLRLGLSLGALGILGLGLPAYAQSMTSSLGTTPPGEQSTTAAVPAPPDTTEPESPADAIVQGYQFIHDRQFAKATTVLEAELARNPSQVEAYVALGIAQELQGESKLAMQQYRAALKLEPTHREATHRLAAQELRQRNLTQAIDLYTHASRQSPPTRDPYFARIALALASDNRPQAVEVFKELLAKTPLEEREAIYFELFDMLDTCADGMVVGLPSDEGLQECAGFSVSTNWETELSEVTSSDPETPPDSEPMEIPPAPPTDPVQPPTGEPPAESNNLPTEQNPVEPTQPTDLPTPAESTPAESTPAESDSSSPPESESSTPEASSDAPESPAEPSVLSAFLGDLKGLDSEQAGFYLSLASIEVATFSQESSAFVENGLGTHSKPKEQLLERYNTELLPLYQKALALAPNHPKVLSQLSALNYEMANRFLLPEDPNLAFTASLQLGPGLLFYSSPDQLNAAKDFLQQSQQQDPTAIAPFVDLTNLLLLNGQVDQALALHQQILQAGVSPEDLYPQLLETNELLTMPAAVDNCNADLGKELNADFSQCIASQSQFKQSQQRYLATLLPQLQNNAIANLALGKLYELQDNVPAAIASYQRSLQLDPSNREAQELLVEILGADVDQIQQQIQVQEQLVNNHPQSLDPFYELLNRYLIAGEVNKAIVLAERIERLRAQLKAPETPSTDIPPETYSVGFAPDREFSVSVSDPVVQAPVSEPEVHPDLLLTTDPTYYNFAKLLTLTEDCPDCTTEPNIPLPTKLAYLQALSERFPEQLETYAVLAQAYADAKQFPSAIQTQEKAIQLDPTNLKHYQTLAGLHQQAKTQQEVSTVERAIPVVTDRRAAYQLLGQLHQQQGNWDGAIAAYQQALKNKRVPPPDPSDTDLFTPQPTAEANLRLELGQIYFSANRLEEAIAQFRIANDQCKGYGNLNCPLFVSPLANSSGHWLAWGTLLAAPPIGHSPTPYSPVNRPPVFDSLDPIPALRLILQGTLYPELLTQARQISTQLQPNFLSSSNSTNVADLKPPNPLAALQQQLEKLPQKQPEDYRRLAILLFTQGKDDLGIATLQEALQFYPEDGATQHLLGWWLTAQLQEAGGAPPASPEAQVVIRHWQTRLQQAPNDPVAARGLGTALIATQQWSEAIAALQSALTLDPKNPTGHVLLAIAQNSQGDALRSVGDHRAQSQASFQAALRLAPNPSPDLYFMYLNGLYSQGKTVQAREVLRPLESNEAFSGPSSAYTSLLRNEIDQAYDRKQYALSEQSLYKYLALTGGSLTNLPEDLGYAYPLLCNLLAQQEKFDQAAPICKKSEQLEPSVASNAALRSVQLQIALRQDPMLLEREQTLPPLTNDPLQPLKRSVVMIFSNNRFLGTGWVIKRNRTQSWIVTNRHVITDDSETELADNVSIELYGKFLTGQYIKLYPATVIHRTDAEDPADVAVLTVANLPEDIQVLPLGVPKHKLGQFVRMIGNPDHQGRGWYVSEGTITHKYSNNLYLSARSGPGGSGSPVLNDENQVVGMLYRGRTDFPGAPGGRGIALPLSLIQGKLQEWGIVPILQQ
jgi:tetratricopeptide (TPR) repeat protein/S1-C subfamily serine protease